MRLALHLARLVVESVRYGLATRRMAVAAVIVIGLLLVALTLTAQVVAPIAMYPFA